MSYEINPDRTQVYLLPPCLDDWVPDDHPVRFIDAFVEALDLKALGFKVGRPPKGRPNYSARLLLSVVLYCNYERVRSFRGMERMCLNNIAAIWLTSNEHPDHNALWRFFRDNKKAIARVFKQSVRIAADAGLVGMVLHAVDGTKIEARASCRTAYYRRKLDDALKRLDGSIEEMERLLEESAQSELGEYRLPEELADAQKRRETVRECLARLEAEEVSSLHPNEPDARVMKCDGRKVFGYNAQAVTDAKAGVVVGADVVNNQSDTSLLARMIENAKETVGGVAETTLADKGYSAAEDLAEAEERGFEVLVNLSKNVDPNDGEKPFHSSRFVYDSERDCCICPLGETLRFAKVKKARGGAHQQVRVYQCKSYKNCPKRWQCSSNKRGRTVELYEHRGAVERQRAKQQCEQAKAKLKRRCVIVEPTFAFAKHTLGFRRWSFGDLEGSRMQWSLICTTINLHKLWVAWRQGLASLTRPCLASAAS